jgi:hypothetical protein
VHSGEDLARKLREGIVTYVQTIQVPGISQTSIGVPPPFHVPPKDQPPAQPLPQVPVDWPPVPTPQNPSVPAPEFPTSWLALTAIGTFVMGWVSARLKTLVGTQIAEFSRTIATLKAASDRKDPPPPPA